MVTGFEYLIIGLIGAILIDIMLGIHITDFIPVMDRDINLHTYTKN
jgi:hypothetical protein